MCFWWLFLFIVFLFLLLHEYGENKRMSLGNLVVEMEFAVSVFYFFENRY